MCKLFSQASGAFDLFLATFSYLCRFLYIYNPFIKLKVNGAFKTKQRGIMLCFHFLRVNIKTRRHTQSMRNTTNVHCSSNMFDLPFQSTCSILKLSKTVMYRNVSACTGMSVNL